MPVVVCSNLEGQILSFNNHQQASPQVSPQVFSQESPQASSQVQMINILTLSQRLNISNSEYLERLEVLRHIHIIDYPYDPKISMWISWPPVYVKPGKLEFKIDE